MDHPSSHTTISHRSVAHRNICLDAVHTDDVHYYHTATNNTKTINNTKNILFLTLMKKITKSLLKSYSIVSGFIFLAGFLFPPMIFHSSPVNYPMLAIYSGLFTLIVSWVFLISGRVIHYNNDRSETKYLSKKE